MNGIIIQGAMSHASGAEITKLLTTTAGIQKKARRREATGSVVTESVCASGSDRRGQFCSQRSEYCRSRDRNLSGSGERAIVFEFHLGCMIAMPTPSVRRRSPLGLRGMSCPPEDDLRFLDDLYAVRSTGESDDGCLLLFDPKNARRIFYVHINSLLVHIRAFDPVHIGLLLSAKRTTVRSATWRNG